MADIDSTAPTANTTAEQVQEVEPEIPQEVLDPAPQTNGSENFEGEPEGKLFGEEGATEAPGEYNGEEHGEECTIQGELLTQDESMEPIDFRVDDVPPQPKLDVHLAIIEEQFRRGFDERYAQPSIASQRQIWEDPAETMRANMIFREVSRGLGGEWRVVFDELMSQFPREATELELGKISMSSPIIQGYKALAAWKEISGRNYSLMKLVEVLRNQEFDDIADAVIHIIDHDDLPNSKDKPAKPVQRRKSDLTPKKNSTILDNRRLLLIAKKIEGNYESLARELGIPEEEVSEIKESEGETYQGTFKVLWSWRDIRHPQQPQPPQQQEEQPSDVDVLKAALEKVDLKAIADKIEEIK